jgi:adenosylhomocysteine nucleosidase
MRVGDLIFADRVVLPNGGSVATDSGWLEAALAMATLAGRKVRVGPIAASDRLLATPADKSRAAVRSGALAGDMESGAAATIAARAGLPLLVVRAISDSAAQSLPMVARVPLRPCGGVRLDAIAGALCKRPGEWPAVARLALDTRAAMVALRGAVQAGILPPPAVTMANRPVPAAANAQPAVAALAA